MSLDKKIERSKKTLKLAAEMSEHYYHKPIIICYSGGKDSDVILRLAMECLSVLEKKGGLLMIATNQHGQMVRQFLIGGSRNTSTMLKVR